MGKGHRFTIAKTEPDKRMVFGWANVAIRKDGTQVEDLQGDVIDPEELEKAAYDHVLRFRSAGERHNPNLRGKGRLIESCVFTKEKQAAMGIPPGVLDEAWWVGYKIDDPDAWAKIKSGDYQMFSVEGKGKRETIAKSYAEAKEDVEKRSPRQRAAKRILGGGAEKPVKNICFLKADSGIIEFRKFNPYHDQIGRFSTANTFITFSPGGNPAQARRSIDRENERRRKEGVAGEVGGKFVNVGTAGGKDGYRPMEYQEAKRLAAEHARQAEQKEQPKSNFKPAKTVKEAEAYAKDQLGVPNVRYGKLSVDVANQMNQSLAEHFNQFPELKKQIQFVGSAQQREKLVVEAKKSKKYDEAFNLYKSYGHSDEQARFYAELEIGRLEKSGEFKPRRVNGKAIAQSTFGSYWEERGAQGITVNEKFGAKTAKIEETAKKAVQTKWNPEGTGTVKAYIDHELGHQMDNITGARHNRDIQKLYDDIDKSGGVKAMGDALSRYAHKSSGKSEKYVEFIAEAWAEYRNNPNPRPTAKQAGRIVEQLYKNKGVTK